MPGKNTYLYLEEGTDQLTEAPLGAAGIFVAVIASTALTAGSFINIYDDDGTSKARAANASNERFADGYVSSSFNINDSAIVFLNGVNTSLLGLIIGDIYFLGLTPGSLVNSPPTGAGETVQLLGRAVSSTGLIFDPVVPIIRS